MVPEFRNKGNKIRYEANKSIMEKINEAVSAIEKGKIKRCQQKLAEGKKIILKQQKLLRIADREKDGQEVVKCYLSDNLASNSEDEKQLSRARREAAANKKKREASRQKDNKKQYRDGPLSEKIPNYLRNHTKDTVALGITQNLKNSVFSADKKGIFNISAQIEETEIPINLDRDWEILDKTEEISVRRRLKEISHFWKNELKPALFVQNIIDNG